MPGAAQDLREKIDQHYRVRLILDNLPITTYDLAENPESIRPGYEVGYERDGKYYLNNHLMFKILVHKTNGQYTRARENMAEIEAAAVIEVRRPRTRCSLALLSPQAAAERANEACHIACRHAECVPVMQLCMLALVAHLLLRLQRQAGNWRRKCAAEQLVKALAGKQVPGGG